MRCCKYPFERINIDWDGQVFFCCAPFVDYYVIGNIYKDSFEDIWYGERAKAFRRDIYNNLYTHCNLKFCFEYNDWNMKDFEESFIDHPPYPKYVHLSYVKACNVRCVTCRDEWFTESKDDINQNNTIIDKVLEICKHAEFVFLNGSGEVFVSEHLKCLVRRISEKYPKIKFMLISNGLLFDEKHVKDFGIEGKICKVCLSIHAATKETYERIVRGGHWEQLQKNLKYISKLKKKGELKELDFNFVFHSGNFREMPAFVKMANKFGAEAYFSRFRKWATNSEMNSNYEKYTCWDPNHPDFEEFMKVLKTINGMKGSRLAEDYFRQLQLKLKKPWYKRLFKRG